MPDFDLTTVIEDAVQDAQVPEEPTTEVGGEVELEASPEAVEAPVEGEVSTEGVEGQTSEVQSPAARQGVQEDQTNPNFAMDKKLGIPSHTNGRENRIPYSRVKRIVENAEKPLNTKISDLEARFTEADTKVKDYEGRLQKVAEFEHIMLNDGPRFLQMLSGIPAYQGFFKAVEDLRARAGQVQQVPQSDPDPMPEPDDKENNVYTMDGLGKLLAWQSRQTEARIQKQMETQYAPIRKEWEQREQLNRIKPVIDAKISEAMKWPKFKENEDKITEFLAQNPTAQLEDAYRVVVFPQLQTDRDAMRQEILAELRQAPTATSAPARPAKSVPTTRTGPKSIEDVIREQLNGISGR